MAILTLQQLKDLWIKGYKPTEQDFEDMFDSLIVLGGGGGVTSVNLLTGAVALTGTADRITISGANTFDIATSFVGQSAITTLGTITTGVWTGTPIANADLANAAVANLSGVNTGDQVIPPAPVTSVNTLTGAVVLSTTDINEGTNEYYTDAKADARITLQKDAVNGLATLDGIGKVPTSQLPALAITDTFVVASQLAMLAVVAQTGDVAVRTDLNKSFILQGIDPTNILHWIELLTPTDTVLSVNGNIGAVTLTTTDISEGTNKYFTDLTGDVTSWGNITAIANGAISNAMLANGAVANLSGTNTGDQNLSSYATLIGAETLTNKRITERTGATTSSATPTINTDNIDFYSLTAQAVDITSFTTNLSGTPTEAQKLWIAITGTAARAISWGSSFEDGAATLPTTTANTSRLDISFIWNSVTSKWRCMAQG